MTSVADLQFLHATLSKSELFINAPPPISINPSVALCHYLTAMAARHLNCVCWQGTGVGHWEASVAIKYIGKAAYYVQLIYKKHRLNVSPLCLQQNVRSAIFWQRPSGDTLIKNNVSPALTFAYQFQGLYSLSGKTSYRQISRSLETARLDATTIVSLWHLTGISAAVLPRCLSNFRAIGKV